MKFVPQWLFRSTRAYRRFAQARDGFTVKLEAAATTKSWPAAAQPFLNKADGRLADQDLDGAWSLLQEAMRQEIPGLQDPELLNREQILRCEADKVQSQWRKSAIDHVMKEGQPQEGRASRLETAQWLLDDYYQNQYYKNGLLQSQLRNLVFISLIALLALLTLIGWAGTDLAKWPDWDWKTLLVVLLFGVLGASFSATRKITDESGKSKIPEMAANFSITVARTVLGATPALAAYAFLRSGLLTVGSSGAAKTPMAVVLAISFAAGFSERLVLGVLESLDSKTGSKPDKKVDPKPDGAAPQH
jgi:hypothetical protein